MSRFLIAAVLFCGIPSVALSQQADQSGSPDSEVVGQAQDPGYLPVDNPGSIIEELEDDAERKDYLFQFPGVYDALKPWYDWKADLYRKHGFRFGISYTAYY